MSLPTRPIRTPLLEWLPRKAYDPLSVLLVYLLVLIAAALAALDAYLPMRSASSVIEKISEIRARTGGGEADMGLMRYWSSLDLANGKNVWTQRTANNFGVGDSMDIELSAIFGKVARYRSHRPNYGSWYATEGANEKFRPVPFLVILCALMLFYPGWSEGTRMFFRAALFAVVVAWFLVVIGTRG